MSRNKHESMTLRWRFDSTMANGSGNDVKHYVEPRLSSATDQSLASQKELRDASAKVLLPLRYVPIPTIPWYREI